MDDVQAEVGLAAKKLALPVVGWTITLDKAVGIATLIYLALQTAHLIWKWRNDVKARKAAQ